MQLQPYIGEVSKCCDTEMYLRDGQRWCLNAYCLNSYWRRDEKEAEVKNEQRETQIEKSGRVIMATINDQLAANEPRARLELARQALQHLGLRVVEIESRGAKVDPAQARCPMCSKKLAVVTGVDRAAGVDRTERNLVTLA